MTRTIPGRARATLAVATAVALLAPAASVAAAPTKTTEPTPAAAGWLAGRLVDGQRLQTAFGGQSYDDPGLTADAVLALSGAGLAADRIASASSWLATQATSYTGDGTTESYAGALAKLAIVADATGADATSFGGQDLVARLKARETSTGRFSDLSEFGDFSNVITQSLAVIALERTTTAGPTAKAVDYLVAQRCDDGGFPLALESEPCESSVDATAFALQALTATGRTTVAASTVQHLLGAQNDDGSFSEGDVPNSNSTGLAAAALSSYPFPTAVDAAQSWLLGLQETCDGAAPGAIVFSPADRGDVQRATAQALLGLAEVDLATVASAGASTDVPTFDCPTRFRDVDYGSNVHVPAINDLVRRGVMRGVTADTFEPRSRITRGQIATTIAKAAGLDPVAGSRYSDTEGNPHEGYINALAEAGIVSGYGDGTFRPLESLRRDQAAAMVARWLELDPVEEDAFDDLAGNVHRTLINALAAEGVASGTAERTFSPARLLVRDQTASFVSRAIAHAEAGSGPTA